MVVCTASWLKICLHVRNYKTVSLHIFYIWMNSSKHFSLTPLSPPRKFTNAQSKSTASRISSWWPIRVTPRSSNSWWVIRSSWSPLIFSLSKFLIYCCRQSSRPMRRKERKEKKLTCWATSPVTSWGFCLEAAEYGTDPSSDEDGSPGVHFFSIPESALAYNSFPGIIQSAFWPIRPWTVCALHI